MRRILPKAHLKCNIQTKTVLFTNKIYYLTTMSSINPISYSILTLRKISLIFGADGIVFCFLTRITSQ